MKAAFGKDHRELAVSPCSYADPCGIGKCKTMSEYPFYTCHCPDGTKGGSCADDACFRCKEGQDPCKDSAAATETPFFSHCELFKFIQCHKFKGCSERKCFDGTIWDTETSTCTVGEDLEDFEGFSENPCELNLCQNEARCIPLDPEVEPQPFLCICPEGFTGGMCELVDLCAPNPCNGGDCVSIEGQNFLCLCNGVLLEHFNKTCCYSCEGINPCSPQNTAAFGYFFDSCDSSSYVRCDIAGGCSEVSCAQYPPPSYTDILTCNQGDEDGEL